MAPAISRPRTMSRSTAAHSMTNMCETEVKPLGERSRRQNVPCSVHAHVHSGVALHGTGHAFGLRAGIVDSRLRRKMRNSTASVTIMIGPPTNSASGELPRQQERQDDAQFDDQVGRGDLEGHRRGEVRTLQEQRARQRHRRVRAGRRGGTQPGRGNKRARAVIAQAARSSHAAPAPGRSPTARTRG